jgi:hypothetical protein
MAGEKSLTEYKKFLLKGEKKMKIKVLVEKDITSSEQESVYINGVEFDIRDDKVWIQIGYNYVGVEKEELSKILKLL